MRHSLITPRPKRLLNPELRLVLFFFATTLVMLVGTYAFLLYQRWSFTQQRQASSAHIETMQREIAGFESKIAFVERERQLGEEIFTANTVLKESIKNLFDLVPERITLSRAELDKRALILYGVTPTKDIYEFMLHAPLRSIFHRSYSSFYPLENGWLRFVSSNYLDEEEP